VEQDTPFSVVAAALRQQRVSAFPVLDEESHVIGVVSARLMYLRGVKRLPVVDAGGRLAGIVSRADVLAVYGRPDAEIAEDIRTGVLSTEGAANLPGTRPGRLRRAGQVPDRLKTIRLPPGSVP
jgi:predicted transcriptional regulator